MKIQLYSIEHAPQHLPYWHTLMDDLCNPPPARVARVLGLSKRSIYRYNATGYAPRAICLAVFWLTSWGRQAVHAQATNDAQVAVGYVNALRSQVEEAQRQIAHIQQIGHFGSANDPTSGNPRRPRNDRLS